MDWRGGINMLDNLIKSIEYDDEVRVINNQSEEVKGGFLAFLLG